MMMMTAPFLLFRIASVYQIVRYYQGKTTKGRARIGAFIADAPILIVFVFYLFLGGMVVGTVLNLPLPIMMIVGLLLIWRYPLYEPTVPWEGSDDFKPWWDEKPDEEAEPTAEDQPW
jgi:hypothetical protein